jgi:hypothetical protein
MNSTRDCGALLMERLGRPMYDLGLPLSRRLEIFCCTAARIWQPAPDCGLPTVPDGPVAQAEYDLGVLMRGDPVELLVGDPLDWAYWLAARTGLDPVTTWEWGVIERLSSGLHCTQIHLQPLGQDALRQPRQSWE